LEQVAGEGNPAESGPEIKQMTQRDFAAPPECSLLPCAAYGLVNLCHSCYGRAWQMLEARALKDLCCSLM